MITLKLRKLIIGSIAAGSLLAVCTAASAEGVYRILPLGNSITQAEVDRASYRYPLWKMLVSSDIQFDFVGSIRKHQSRYSDVTPPQPDYKGQSFDRDHEGHFGWRIDEIIGGRDFDNGSGSGKLKEWTEEYDVDIALIHLGTNDAFSRQSNESSVKELKEVIRILRDDNPEVIVLLAKLIPVELTPGDGQPVESLNAAIPKVAEDMGSEQSPVVLVDHFEGFDVEEHTYDGVHPNEAGEELMARRWFKAIQSVVETD